MLRFARLVEALLVALAVAALQGCSSAPVMPKSIARGDYTSVTKHVARLIEYEMKANKVTGLSIALVDDQRIVWAQGFGHADKANNVAATPQTVYRAGSISKLFNAMAAMQLVEQGKLNLDQPLQNYLPEFSIKSRFPRAGPITARGIMSHHSGLPSDLGNGMFTENPASFTTVASRLKDEFVAYPPNYIFAYSNVGVTLLGHAIQRIVGEEYAAHMDRSLLQPMGMVNSAFAVRAEGPLMSKPYRDDVQGTETPLRDMPAGGLNTNVLDLGRFMQMVFARGQSNGRSIVRPETLVQMLSPQNADVALDMDVRLGLGWFLNDNFNAGLVAGHGGGTVHHHSQLSVLTEHKLGVVVMSNSATARQAVDTVAAAALKLALQAKAGIAQPKRPATESLAGPTKDLDFNQYIGFYATLFGLVRISHSGDRLYADIAGNRVELLPQDQQWARLQYRLFGTFPLPVKSLENILLSRAKLSGREVVIVKSTNRRSVIGEKIVPVALSEPWLERIGDYEVLNGAGDPLLPKKIGFRLREGFPVIEFDGVAAIVLSPLSDTEALTLGLGRGRQETVRIVTEGGEERVTYSGYLLRKIRPTGT